MPYLESVIKETFRIRPPVPLSIPHVASRDCTIHGYFIEKGTLVSDNCMYLSIICLFIYLYSLQHFLAPSSPPLPPISLHCFANFIVLVYGICNSEKYFKNPSVFNPDRWRTDASSPSSSPLESSQNLLTFGYGPTICLGMPVAKQVISFLLLLISFVSIVLTYILRRFS